MGQTPEIKDRIFFSVSFLTLFATIAVSGYTTLLSQIIIINFFDKHTFSLFELLILIAVFLFLSVYCSALENIIPSTIKIICFQPQNICNRFASLFYLIAILGIPFIIIIFAFFSILTSFFAIYLNRILPTAENTTTVLTSILIIMEVILKFINIGKKRKSKQ